MIKHLIIVCLLIFNAFLSNAEMTGIEIVNSYFHAVKERNEEQTQKAREQLRNISFEQLKKELNNDSKKKVFWINLYNTSVRYALWKAPEEYNNRFNFFRQDRAEVAGYDLSLDQIEHGILRRSQTKIGRGNVKKHCISRFEKAMRVNKLDPRIHFALNCGARSCPKIMLYKVDRVDFQLDDNMLDYVCNSIVSLPDEIQIPVIFSWYRGDFGGMKGVRQFLIENQLIDLADHEKKITFQDYDWTISIKPYRNN